MPHRDQATPPLEGERPSGPLSEGIACLCIWASGTDVDVDHVVRLGALRGAPGGATWEDFGRGCSVPEGAAGPLAEAFGAGPAGETPRRREEAWAELRAFVGQRPVLCPDARATRLWAGALDRAASIELPALEVIGLDELASLLEPGALSALPPPALLAALVDPAIAPSPAGAIQPPHVLAAVGELVARFADLGPAALAVCAWAWAQAAEALGGTDPGAARRLATMLTLADRPGSWGGPVEILARGRLADGRLSGSRVEDVDPDDPLAVLEPAVSRTLADVVALEKLRPDIDEHAPFPPEDLALLDDLFRVHLPAIFAPRHSEEARADLYRKSQHRVAEEIARCLGSDELLLLHAPTGTGKTLAYLLPALIWSRRHDVRVGVATYTRALQSQAMEREVPRALAALARAGFEGGSRVTLLKGREHSLCWRALRAQVPIGPSDDGETWLAWTALTLFGLRDGDGDLDRFPKAPPVELRSSADYGAALRALLTQARGRTGCCSNQSDKETCAAEVARARAERSHVVLTNQSFALARPEFFRRVVFDECEHLHDQAMGAWSHRVSFGAARQILNRLHEPGRRSGAASRRRPPLDRLARHILPGTGAHERYSAARTLWSHASSALASLESAVLEYERWRTDASLGRTDAELHGLFREYVTTSGQAEAMVESRVALTSALGRLSASVSQLAEELDGLPMRGRARIRRALELARVDIVGLGEAIDAWIPVDDGEVRFSDAVFNDVERNVRGEAVLASLVLLPGDALGKHYYPELGSAAFVSATTRLGGSFEKAKGYLGLDRVAHVDAETGDFDRSGGTRRVTTFHAPEVFDYSRVMAGVPRGVPSVRDREAYIAFLGRYLPWLAERTRGRMLVLFTSLRDVAEVAERASEGFRRRGLPLLWQGMGHRGKEELSSAFRDTVESTLLGVDTFWYGADFPGETLEVLCIARLPYGVPDRYHHAQCAAIGAGAQRARIYMPRALAKFRQGFGRLMRKASDRGVVLVLDSRITERRHKDFLGELPVQRIGAFGDESRARLVRGDIDLVSREVLAHLGLTGELGARGLSTSFTGGGHAGRAPAIAGRDVPLTPAPRPPRREETGPIEVDPDELPF